VRLRAPTVIIALRVRIEDERVGTRREKERVGTIERMRD
jgi:hypothetical protein